MEDARVETANVGRKSSSSDLACTAGTRETANKTATYILQSSVSYPVGIDKARQHAEHKDGKASWDGDQTLRRWLASKVPLARGCTCKDR